jgi:hypothetical protein
VTGRVTVQRVLFIGGTGTISTVCAQRAAENGFEVSLLNRGSSTLRPVRRCRRPADSLVHSGPAGMAVLKTVRSQNIPSFWLPTARATAQACEPRVDRGQPFSGMTDVRVVTACVEHGRLPGWVSTSRG